jgi:hypothetical protein
MQVRKNTWKPKRPMTWAESPLEEQHANKCIAPNTIAFKNFIFCFYDLWPFQEVLSSS